MKAEVFPLAITEKGMAMKIPFIVMLILVAMLIGLSLIFTVLIPS